MKPRSSERIAIGSGDEAQRQWHEANRQMEEVETQRDAALDEYFDIRGFK
jgi:hypothetical protein